MSIQAYQYREFVSERFPGILATVTVAMAASFMSDHYGVPLMLMALLLGMAFSFSTENSGPCIPGIEFSSKKILRFGVALLGVRISFSELVDLGIKPLVLVVSSVFVIMFAGMVLARLLGLRKDFGLLTGGAVAICGASAALAISTTLPKHQDSERDTIFTVVGVTALSTLAMIVYPIISRLLGFDDTTAGIFLGATIHDVAQVVGAGYTISDQAGDVATLVKLMRVAMLVPVVFLLIFYFRKDSSQGSDAVDAKVPMPLFLVGFVALMLVNNTGFLPASVTQAIVELSRWCLVIAIAALGMKTSLKNLLQVGAKAISLIVINTILLMVLTIIAINFVL